MWDKEIAKCEHIQDKILHLCVVYALIKLLIKKIKREHLFSHSGSGRWRLGLHCHTASSSSLVETGLNPN
jgi:hypothetical protein